MIPVAQSSSGETNFGAKVFGAHFSSNVNKMAAQHYLEGQVDNEKLTDCVREYRAILLKYYLFWSLTSLNNVWYCPRPSLCGNILLTQNLCFRLGRSFFCKSQ